MSHHQFVLHSCQDNDMDPQLSYPNVNLKKAGGEVWGWHNLGEIKKIKINKILRACLEENKQTKKTTSNWTPWTPTSAVEAGPQARACSLLLFLWADPIGWVLWSVVYCMCAAFCFSSNQPGSVPTPTNSLDKLFSV